MIQRLSMGHRFDTAAGMRPLARLIGKVNANVYQNLLQQLAVLPLRASPNQPANFMQDNAGDFEMVSPESRLKSNRESIKDNRREGHG